MWPDPTARSAKSALGSFIHPQSSSKAKHQRSHVYNLLTVQISWKWKACASCWHPLRNMCSLSTRVIYFLYGLSIGRHWTVTFFYENKQFRSKWITEREEPKASVVQHNLCTPLKRWQKQCSWGNSSKEHNHSVFLNSPSFQIMGISRRALYYDLSKQEGSCGRGLSKSLQCHNPFKALNWIMPPNRLEASRAIKYCSVFISVNPGK